MTKFFLILAISILGIFLIAALLYDVPEGPPYREISIYATEGSRAGTALAPTKYYEECPIWVRVGTEWGMIPVAAEIILIFVLVARPQH